jgi:ribonucleoside-triphosphate reductase
MSEDKKIPTEVFSRVCGYYRPIDQANKGKREEISERKVMDVKNLREILKNKQKKGAGDETGAEVLSKRCS